ncbi:MAG: hypothetical protein OXH50_09310, partial [Gemmatimonadetes bacterium]|nr:hypothetical protein [Gemmatimonadota bacterium]
MTAAGGRPLRVGLVGTGGVCEQVHFPGFSRIPGVEGAALVEGDCGRLESRLREWEVAAGYSH